MQNEKVQTTNACIPKCENENLFTLANDSSLYKSLTADNYVNGYSLQMQTQNSKLMP